jgi:hypothetical protein
MLTVLLSLGLWAAFGCGGGGGGGTNYVTGTSSGTGTGTGATVSFATDVFPTFNALGCDASNCHDATSASSGINLTGTPTQAHTSLLVHATAVNIITPASSALLIAPLTGSDPLSHLKPFLDTADANYVIWLQWITEGGVNN